MSNPTHWFEDEELVEMLLARDAGYTINEIANHVGYHASLVQAAIEQIDLEDAKAEAAEAVDG
ncbi:MAG: hypothetical protein AAF844_00145 [Pseudomonadota bacterium]